MSSTKHAINPHPGNTSRSEAWEDGFAGRELQMCAAGGPYALAYREGAAAALIQEVYGGDSRSDADALIEGRNVWFPKR